jgi:hypothetical protein
MPFRGEEIFFFALVFPRPFLPKNWPMMLIEIPDPQRGHFKLSSSKVSSDFIPASTKRRLHGARDKKL